MKLKVFLDKLNRMVEENRNILDLDVIYAKDDESNGFQEVIFHPCFGNFDEGEFASENEEDMDLPTNAICIN